MSHAPTASLKINGNTTELDVREGSLGKPVTRIHPIMSEGLFSFDPGFFVTAHCASSITFIDGNQGVLLHRGYAIDDLAQNSDYMELCHLLIKGHLPNAHEKNAFIQTVKKHGQLQQQMTHFFNGFRRDAHPMAIMVGVVGALSAFYPQQNDVSDAEYQLTCAMQLVAKMPVIAAMSHKYASDQPFINPDNALSYAENFLRMMFATPYETYEANPVLIRAMDRIFMLHADHEQNASTTTVRVAGSTGANPFACISAGIGALWGPAHGGANEACLNMLETIGTPERIPEFLARAKDKQDPFRLMGFGHRVYKNHDPRATVMRATCHEVLEAVGAHDDPVFKLALQLETIAREDSYFIERNLYPNVDFYSGITLRALGIPTNMFTVIFALARSVGWIAQWMEMMNDPEARLARPRQLYIGATQRTVPPLEKRD